MKCLLVLVALAAVASAQYRQQSYRAPAQPAYRAAASSVSARSAAAPRASSSDQNANIVRYESDNSPDGGYSWVVETDNGIAAQEQGTPRQFGGNPPLSPVVAQGSYAYTAPDGQQVSISYVADENGYQPQGAALPTPPPVPPQIARALEWIARNPAQRKK